MTAEELVIKGHAAAQVLENPLVKEAFEEVRKHIMLVWESTPANDVEQRENTWRLYKAAQVFEEVFKGYVDTGRVAADKLKHEKSLLQKFKAVI